jgi:predicted acylesterase/phospholipase RssA/CRP-like cAMP-binding protein
MSEPIERMEQSRAVDFLGASEMFRSLDRGVLESIAEQLEPVHVPAGGVFIEQGDPGDCLYVLFHGRLRVFLREGTQERPLQELSPGQVVGEIALLTDQPRAASVSAIRDSDLFRLPKAAFRDLIDRHPSVLRQVSHVLVDRLLTADRPAGDATTVRTIAVVPVGDRLALSEFSRRLVRALSRYGSTTLVSSSVVGAALGEGVAQAVSDPVRRGRLQGWLHDLEDHYRYIVYEADAAPSEAWTQRCLRQADLVLLAADARDAPAAEGLENEPLAGASPSAAARRELVLVHPSGSVRVAGTAGWLDPLKVAAHHHVREDRDADYRRLARFVTGRACGLVLSGGAARGLAHLGAMRALEEADIPIDFVGGTSIGAAVGGFLAQGLDHEARIQVVVEALEDIAVNLTFPIVSLSSGRKVTRFLWKHLSGQNIEDLWTSYFCVSANLTRATVVVHERGELALAVRASVSIPGIFPPVFYRGDILVDGGVMNNLPVDVMCERLRGGTMVAVDLNTEVEPGIAKPFDTSLSGWLVLMRKLNPFDSPLDAPSIFNVLTRSIELSDTGARPGRIDEAAVDLHLRPPVGRCGMFDFKAAYSLIDLTYRYTAARIEDSTLRDLIW